MISIILKTHLIMLTFNIITIIVALQYSYKVYKHWYVISIHVVIHFLCCANEKVEHINK